MRPILLPPLNGWTGPDRRLGGAPAERARRPGRGLLPAPTGAVLGSPPGTRPPQCRAGVRVRCSQPRVSRPST